MCIPVAEQEVVRRGWAFREAGSNEWWKLRALGKRITLWITEPSCSCCYQVMGLFLGNQKLLMHSWSFSLTQRLRPSTNCQAIGGFCLFLDRRILAWVSTAVHSQTSFPSCVCLAPWVLAGSGRGILWSGCVLQNPDSSLSFHPSQYCQHIHRSLFCLQISHNLSTSR